MKHYTILVFKFLYYKLTSHSRRGHGIHSPFAWDFVQKVLNAPKSDSGLMKVRDVQKKIEMQALLTGENSFGAGSSRRGYGKFWKDRAGKISVSKKQGALLYHLLRFAGVDEVVELGTGSGISLLYLAEGGRDAQITTVEGDQSRVDFVRKNLDSVLSTSENIHLVCSSFDSFLKNYRFPQGKILFFIDGDHTYEAVLRYFSHIADEAKAECIIVFDDIRWSSGMEKAWKEIKADKRLCLSIDLFFTGIVFLNRNMARQDFVINF